MPHFGRRTGSVLLAALVVAISARAPDRARLVATAVAALALVLVSGLRLEATGVAVLDVVATAVLIGWTASAVRLVSAPDEDTLPVTIGLAAAAAMLALALADGSDDLASLAAATAASCTALLAARRTVLNLFLGDVGRAFLGVIMATGLLAAAATRSPQSGLLVAVLPLAVPLFDHATVSLARLRRGQRLASRQGGHLLRRLSARGLSDRVALAVLAGAHLALVAVTVLVAGARLSGGQAALTAGVVLGGLAALTLPVRVYRRTIVGLPRRVRLAAAAAVLLPVVLAIPAVVTLLMARRTVESGARAASAGLEAARAGDTALAAGRFEEAALALGGVERSLGGPLPSLGLVVPVLAPNLQAARALVTAGADLARSGHDVARASDMRRLRVKEGRVPVEEIRNLQPTLARAADTVRTASERIEALDRPWLLPFVRRQVDDLGGRLHTALGDVETAADAARLAPAILGADAPRRYFLAVQNNAEARGTGGLIGNFGEVVLEGGAIRVERFGRVGELTDGGNPDRALKAPAEYRSRYGRFGPARWWQNVNMSPDFPTVAAVIADLYPQSGGRPVDGVISIDPPGLAALLELTGPVKVSGWPRPIDADNVVDVTLREAYDAFAKAQRIDFLGDVAARITESLTKADLGDPSHVARTLGEAVRQRHLMVYLASPEEQHLIDRLGLSGEVPRRRADSLMLVTQNAAANKIDYYLRRQLHYAVTLTPDGATARVAGRLDVTLENAAPSSGLVPYVIGPSSRRFQPGENFTYLSMYGRTTLSRPRLDGRPEAFESARELGHNVYSKFFSIPSKSVRRVSFDVDGSVALDPRGWYTLQLVRQPLIAEDQVEVTVQLSEGWVVAEAEGMEAAGRRARAAFKLGSDRVLRLRVERVART